MTTERQASWETFVEGPKSAGLNDAIRQGAITYGLTLVYINENKAWLTTTVYFKVSGDVSKVTAFQEAVTEAINEQNSS